MRFRICKPVLLIVLVLLVTGGPVRSAAAATFDIADGDVPGLIAAINAANSNGEADTINLDSDATYTLVAIDNDTDGPNGLPTVTSEITIEGNASTIRRGSGEIIPMFRPLHVSNNGRLSLSNVVVTGGSLDPAFDNGGGGIHNRGVLSLVDTNIVGNFVVGNGGGLYNAATGTVTLVDSSVDDNRASWDFPQNSRGGGIANVGGSISMIGSSVSFNRDVGGSAGGIWSTSGASITLEHCRITDNQVGSSGGGVMSVGNSHFTATDSAIDNNSGDGFGGGIYNSGPLLLRRCSISGNRADDLYGGGIYFGENTAAVAELINCTVSENNAPAGAGIYSLSYLILTNCTVYGNFDVGTGFGGGIFASADTTVLANTIVANNTAYDCRTSGGVVGDGGYNIIGDGTCISAPTSFSGDPMLGPRANNGGPTMTHALLPGSPAIDAIDNNRCALRLVTDDQRGLPRPQRAGCDIGAFEVQLGDGDFDNDGDIDLSDFAMFSLCFAGSNVPPAGTCPPGVDADFDNDGDVDLSDGATFSLNFTGPL